MPKRKKKTKEEKVVEAYFPIDGDDLKLTIEKKEKAREEKAKTTIEKEYSKPDRESLEIVEKKKTKKRKTSTNKKYARGGWAGKPSKYSPPKIELKKEGYELIITEKPQAASKIASALGNPTRKASGQISYYEVDRQNKKIIVACAVGHLFTLKQNNFGANLPVFDISWIPNYLVKKGDFTKKYYDTILKLAKNAASITIATDYDIEGELIGLNVLRFICAQKDANRMKFSTLTNQELNQSYENKSTHMNWGQAIAGETRHYLDWFYGINLSRALMNAIKTTGSFKIMSIGRVQGPTLNLIVQKEKEIQSFKSEPYWQVFITIDKPKLELKYIKDIFDKSELKKFKNLKGKKALAKTEKTQNILPPNPPFNLTTLQTETYKFHGITPSNTLRLAQSLYLAGLISYPRTSSQKLPESINYKKILDILKKEYKVSKLITKSKPIEGRKTDPAHPSIYPTGNKQILTGDEEKVYNLIVKRFLSLFCDNAIIDNKKVIAKVGELEFVARGSEIKKKAWMEIYPSKLKETEIPDVEGEVTIIGSKTDEKETQPPKRYSQASIISQLEKKNLGTKATRAMILETLYNRGYIKDQIIQATPLGMSLITTLKKYSPIIIDEKLTRSFEQEMESLISVDSGKELRETNLGRVGGESRKVAEKSRAKLTKSQTQGGGVGTPQELEKKEQKIIDSSKKTITEIIKDFEKNEKKIGQELLQANIEHREQEKIENQLMTCPTCKKGNLTIIYSRKNKRNFVACNAYPKCTQTYSLPPGGMIKKIEKTCEKCGFPILQRIAKGKRPWEFCFNSACESNKERLEKYRKNKK